ncbi:3-deoxy-manno-octulosonate cytidylyltransferase [Sphingomonas pokkalii]|uniref:3-deoxy-manno-octulosonate cytidylyltransferase n=1 Tax=Sphingomonas pokkalii TaxID=2175090 RepID=A0A2U0S9R6_9SPHN|nr:3-deoxy-manno-octulosonate cytidylyltransferase [Sphingomonas pokkalii]PVX28035.1 3-deoxy-manno-octulosonate cytidylyltransferase [Sphingomonas pokkalii]
MIPNPAVDVPVQGEGIIVIPARYASSRYPGKPLALLRGATGIAQPLIARSIAAARSARLPLPLHIATDDDRIAAAVQALGEQPVLTPASCLNGTERVAAAIEALAISPSYAINFQGDALLTPPQFVAALADWMERHPDCAVATVAVPCSASVYAHLVIDQAAGRSGGTTVVVDSKGRALYFSKRVLPFMGGPPLEGAIPVLLHLGLYAYRPEALQRYRALPPSPAELAEGLEQLRFLHHGIPIDVVVLDAPDWDPIELNNPSDLAPIEAILAARGLA